MKIQPLELLKSSLEVFKGGLFFIDSQLLVQGPYLGVVKDWFDGQTEQESVGFLDYFFPVTGKSVAEADLSQSFRENVCSVFSMVFGEDEVQWQLTLQHLPEYTVVEKEGYGLRYIPGFESNGSLWIIAVLIYLIGEQASLSDQRLGGFVVQSRTARVVSDAMHEVQALDQQARKREQEAEILQEILSEGRGDLEEFLLDALDEVETLKRQSRTRSEELEKIQELSEVGRPNIDDFLDDSYELVQDSKVRLVTERHVRVIFESLTRTLHTLKGNSGMYGFLGLTRRLHVLEGQALTPLPEGYPEEALMNLLSVVWDELEQVLRSYAEVSRRMFQVESKWVKAEEELDLREIPFTEGDVKRLHRFLLSLGAEESVVESVEYQHALQLVTQGLGIPVEEIHRRLELVCNRFSEKLGKKVQFQVEAMCPTIPAIYAKALISSLGHLLRNCLDHGIESADIRAKAGKETEGLISLVFRREGDATVIILADDGQGLDLNRIVESAIAKDLVSAEQGYRMSSEDQADLIFHHGVSSRQEVSLISGRGIGMSSVKETIQKLGGLIRVRSDFGRGTRFEIFIPDP